MKVERQSEPNVRLKSLSIGQVPLSPAFSPTIFHYAATVEHDVYIVTVEALLDDPDATVVLLLDGDIDRDGVLALACGRVRHRGSGDGKGCGRSADLHRHGHPQGTAACTAAYPCQAAGSGESAAGALNTDANADSYGYSQRHRDFHQRGRVGGLERKSRATPRRH